MKRLRWKLEYGEDEFGITDHTAKYAIIERLDRIIELLEEDRGEEEILLTT